MASQLEIKKAQSKKTKLGKSSEAYRERAAEWHPDKKGHLDEVGFSAWKRDIFYVLM